MDSWRLIPLIQAHGTLHMAIDEWFLEQHRLGSSPPVLRFYTWAPSAISLGYHQKHWPSHWNHLTWNGLNVELVRRPSGGRAVLHYGDLTYAVITSGLSGNRMKTYQTLCQFLIDGWRSFGIHLRYGTRGRGYIHNHNCFGTSTSADLIIEDGTKFIGSAQLRRGQAILQHGSMQLAPDLGLFQYVFGVPLEDSLFHHQPFPSISTVVNTLIDAACRSFSVNVTVQPLSPAEITQIVNSDKAKQRC